MKKFYITLMAMLLSISAFAYDYEKDGIYYSITSEEDKTVEVVGAGFSDIPNDVTIPTTVTIGDTPYTVTSIGDGAFYENGYLYSITIGNSVKTIGESAFYRCLWLETFKLIGNSVTSIGENAFEKCTALNKVTFDNAESLCKINFSNDEANPLYYAKHLYFQGVENEITNLVIPDGVTYIGTYALSHFGSLTSVTIGNSVKTIGAFSFDQCENLASVTFGSSVESIGIAAFESCTSLESIVIPNSVKSIEMGAFVFCENLTSLTIGSSVENIESGAFAFCNKLETVTCLNETPPTCNEGEGDDYFPVFAQVETQNIPLYVPDISVDAYKNALVWKDFKATIPTKVEDITIIDATEVERFDLSGRKITKPVQGVNIVRYSDGSVRKETR